MLSSIRGLALITTALASVPAAAVLPDPNAPGAPFALESAGYNDPSGNTPGSVTYASHFGSGAATATQGHIVNPPTNPPTFYQVPVAQALVEITGYPYVSLTATNPLNPAGSAFAHGELSYQYQVSYLLSDVNGPLVVGDAYAGVVEVKAASSIHTAGPTTQLSITTSAQESMAQMGLGLSFTEVRGDGSDNVAYDSYKTYDFAGAGTYTGNTTINGNLYAQWTGTIRLYANVLGTTTSHTMISDGVTPPGLPAGVPYTVTVNDHPGATGTLMIDPLITPNASFMQAYNLGAATVSLSPGVANASAPSGAPEPAAWALLIAGFGLTGAVQRRRRVVAA